MTALIKSNGKKVTIKQPSLPLSLFAANGQINVQIINSDGQSSNLVFIKVGTDIGAPVVTGIAYTGILLG
ncbi:MAG: hypothetical protein AB1489_31675 [Acidobacteriota bacterium]